MPPPTVLVTSLGLMGGSLAAALAAAGWRVLLHHRRPEVATRAQALGYGSAVNDLADGLRRADLVVVCTPVGAVADTVRAMAALSPRPLFTDVGSVKGAICAQLGDLARAGRFVGSHPMAGSHLQGLEHARADLYRGCITVVTPLIEAPEAATMAVESMWQAVGSRTCRIVPELHDRAVAEASHVPHVLAAVAAAGLGAEATPLAASGFRDTTRVAAGSPELWTDILIHNRDAVLTGIDAAQERLRLVRAALAQGDHAALTKWLELARAARNRFEREHRLATESDSATAE